MLMTLRAESVQLYSDCTLTHYNTYCRWRILGDAINVSFLAHICRPAIRVLLGQEPTAAAAAAEPAAGAAAAAAAAGSLRRGPNKRQHLER